MDVDLVVGLAGDRYYHLQLRLKQHPAEITLGGRYRIDGVQTGVGGRK